MILLSVFCFVLGGMDHPSILKEDLQVIRKFQNDSRARELAQKLNLTQEQAALLKEVKKQVDAIKSEHEDQIEKFEMGQAPFVKEVRAQYESGATPSTEDLEKLHQMRDSFENIKREMKLKMELATLPLKDFLTKQQRETLRDLTVQKLKGERREERPRPHRGIREVRSTPGKIWFRILLSDSFVSAL